MKLLKIDSNKGYFLDEENKYIPLDKISKDDLLKLVDLALEENATYDKFDKDKLQNQAHQIIYKSLYEKLSALSEDRKEFIDESKRQFLTEYEKYSVSSS